MHYHHFLSQTKSTHFGGRGEGLRPCEDFPLDVVVLPLVFQVPHVAGQGGLAPLRRVFEVGLVVAVPCPPLRHGEADVRLLLAGRLHLRLVNGVGVQAPGSLHGAVLCPSTAVAVRVEQPLNWQLVLQQFGVVPGDDATQIGHSAV